MIIRAAIFILLFQALSLEVSAANAPESLWRAESGKDVPSEVVPPFTGGDSPFPQKIIPREPEPLVITPNASITEEMIRERERARRAAYLLERIRQIIMTESILAPDVSSVHIDAKVKGPNGARILIRNKWIEVGDPVVVPSRGTAEGVELLEELEELDANLASIVRADIEDRLAQSSTMNLKLGEIGDDFVRLVDDKKQDYVISVIPSGW